MRAWRHSVSDSPVELVGGGDGKVSISNRGDEAIFLGGSDVTTSDGFQVDPGVGIGLRISASEAVYAIAETGPVEVHVLVADV